MWLRTFEARLASWQELRSTCATQPLEQALMSINRWWFEAPWCAYHLHWDDQAAWPDPWQLLDDNIYCDLARALGIMYTITLIDRSDVQSARLVEIDADNLVEIPPEKYILNWDQHSIVNTNLTLHPVRHSVSQQQLKQQIQ